VSTIAGRTPRTVSHFRADDTFIGALNLQRKKAFPVPGFERSPAGMKFRLVSKKLPAKTHNPLSGKPCGCKGRWSQCARKRKRWNFSPRAMFAHQHHVETGGNNGSRSHTLAGRHPHSDHSSAVGFWVSSLIVAIQTIARNKPLTSLQRSKTLRPYLWGAVVLVCSAGPALARLFIPSDRTSYAWAIQANIVSPPRDGISRESSIEPSAGI
jgi:hypothetical protein